MQTIIGKDIARLDAPEKAMGIAKYAGDYSAPGMLHVALCRSQIAAGKIIDVHVPTPPEGVYCFTLKDIPVNIIPSVMNDQPVLAENIVRYYGEPFAIVAADTLSAAQAFARKVTLEAEPLPLVEDPKFALNSDAPKLFQKGNLCADFHSKKGDAEKAFENSALVLENTFTLPVQSHGFLEPESAFTYKDESGRLCLISSTQNAFSDRRTLASVLNLPIENVYSKAAAVGGGFGGKDGNTSQIYPAIVTHYTGRPARYCFTREENIRYGMKRHSGKAQVKMGFAEDGKILALEGKMWLDTGAYALLGPAVIGLGMEHMTGPYYIPNVTLDGWLAYTNHTPASAMRGFGAPQSAFATESLVNLAAERLGISPLEIRRINAIHQGQSFSMGAEMEHSVGFEEALKMFRNTPFYKEMCLPRPQNVGYGIAAGLMSSGMGKHVPDTAYATVEKKPEGGWRVRAGLVDIGQGSRTVFAMLCAQALGVDVDEIEVVMADSDKTADSGSTAASRSTYVLGNAILDACEKIKQGAEKAEGKCVFPEIKGEDGVHSIFGFIVQGVKLEVNPITGAVKLLDVCNITEAGRVIHPGMIAGQIFGGIVMSAGYALSEELRYINGKSMEDGFDSYIMPTAMDAPHLTNANAEQTEESGPYGAKGIAEAATVALAPAVCAALRDIYPALEITALPIDRLQILNAERRPRP